MKTFLVVFSLAAFGAVVYIANNGQMPKFGHSYEKEIKAHRAAIGMTQGDLRQSLGEPLMTKKIVKGSGVEDQWFYAGQQITLQDGVVSQIETAQLNPAAFATPAPQRTLSYDPAVGYIEHDANVSAAQSYGRGGGYARATPMPSFVHGMQGTALDQKAHR